jgi:hypothetical protein
MSIIYTYEIIAVDEAARCMEIVYSASGHQAIHIGARLPYEGESLQAVIEEYAPVAYWLEQKKPVIVPEVGKKGTVIPIVNEQPAQQTISADTAFAPIFPTPASGSIDRTVFE